MELLLSLIRKVIPEGKLTNLAMAALGILTAIFGADAAMHDQPATDVIETGWISLKWYAVAFGAINAIGGAGLRSAVAQIGKPQG